MLSYAAVWPGLYVAAGVAYISQIGVGRVVRWDALLMSLLTGMGAYLLDRAKLRDDWLDPPDGVAHPERFEFVRRHRRGLRVMALLWLAGATWLGWRMSDGGWGAAMPVLSAAGVVAYAAGPRRGRARPKDVLVLKNAYVAGGICGFALLTHLAACGARVGELAGGVTPALVYGVVTLFLRVGADSVLCDLDDAHADRRFGTATLATRLGRVGAWNVAFATRLVLAGVLAAGLVGDPRAGLFWGVATGATSLWLRVARPRRLRDWVDGRFAIEAAVVLVATAFSRGG